MTTNSTISFEEAKKIFERPFMELLADAHNVHIKHFRANTIQISTLLSVKTGACIEDCAYCAQSAHYQTSIQKHKLFDTDTIVEFAKVAKQKGSHRFCMGASGRSPSDKELDSLCEAIIKIKAMGLETCATLGLLTEYQAQKLKESGLDFYNHNIDTSPEFYPKIISTRTLQDRLDTIQVARDAGLKICAGGIMGMGETNEDRINMLVVLANFPIPPESIPINHLVKIPGTPLSINKSGDSKNNDSVDTIDCFDFVRIVALARILMPTSYIRLAAGRNAMNDSLQALCFFAGANSVFYGEKLLTTSNNTTYQDDMLFSRLNLQKEYFTESSV
ncbi:biotin synthase BioB [Helicobacter aurati]|uniref:biotin synthase BioB n=1 Tax=Helicobacter aurati TaxID=137778 RepID=UPI0015F1A8CC|nr:biotin synthase BioB [Helicobacter aurati]